AALPSGLFAVPLNVIVSSRGVEQQLAAVASELLDGVVDSVGATGASVKHSLRLVLSDFGSSASGMPVAGVVAWKCARQQYLPAVVMVFVGDRTVCGFVVS